MAHETPTRPTRPRGVVEVPLLRRTPAKVARRRDATTWLNAAMVAAILYLVGGIVGGIVVALIERQDPTGIGGTSYPYLGVGIAAAAFSAFSGTIGAAVVAYLQWRVAEAAETR